MVTKLLFTNLDIFSVCVNILDVNTLPIESYFYFNLRFIAITLGNIATFMSLFIYINKVVVLIVNMLHTNEL